VQENILQCPMFFRGPQVRYVTPKGTTPPDLFSPPLKAEGGQSNFGYNGKGLPSATFKVWFCYELLQGVCQHPL